MSPYVRDLVARCECGHEVSLHVYLPGHPDGAVECQGTDDCECGRIRVVMRGRERFA
jgi:hypothetical protein